MSRIERSIDDLAPSSGIKRAREANYSDDESKSGSEYDAGDAGSPRSVTSDEGGGPHECATELQSTLEKTSNEPKTKAAAVEGDRIVSLVV